MKPGRHGHDAAGLVELIDKLELLFNKSELSELEIEAGQTALLLRKPGALGRAAETAESPSSGTTHASAGSDTASTTVLDEGAPSVPSGHAVVAPLTGLYYDAPSPGAEPYVKEGGLVVVGQVIGLIEAMKLFNEIKSDVAGRVVRIFHESGALVKARQPLIEVEPT